MVVMGDIGVAVDVAPKNREKITMIRWWGYTWRQRMYCNTTMRSVSIVFQDILVAMNKKMDPF